MNVQDLEAVRQSGASSASPATGFVPTGGSLAASRALGGATMAGIAGADGLGMSPELLEEMDETPAPRLAGASPMGTLDVATASETSTSQVETARNLSQSMDELVTLQHLLQSQVATGDPRAQETLARMQETANHVNAMFESAGADATDGGVPAADAAPGAGSAPARESGEAHPATEAVRLEARGVAGTAAGRKLAAIAVKHAKDGKGDGHHCYTYVTQDLKKLGIRTSGAGAYEAAAQLARNPKVRELKGISASGLRSLPPGAIVVWNKGKGHPYGHISIATGDGHEASDVMRDQITNYGTSYRVFMPK